MSEYLDSSVIVKWYKKSERYHQEALLLHDRISNREETYVTSEFTTLELVRALVKSGHSKRTVNTAFADARSMMRMGYLVGVSIGDVLVKAKDIEIDLNLSAGDAIHLASSIYLDCDIFWSMDHDHLKASATAYMKDRGVAVRDLTAITD